MRQPAVQLPQWPWLVAFCSSLRFASASEAFNGLTCMVYGEECNPSSLRREGTLTFAPQKKQLFNVSLPRSLFRKRGI